MTKGRGHKTSYPVEGDAFKSLQRPQKLCKPVLEAYNSWLFTASQIVLGLGEGLACEESKEN